MVTYDTVRNDPELKVYIESADRTLCELGYTEHSYAHIERVAQTAGYILGTLGYPQRYVELTRIAAYLHDVGNVVNRVGHAQSGAIIAFELLTHMGMEASETAEIVSAIGNHDEGTAQPVSPMAAALILGDKCDVRRSRVRNPGGKSFDIHDRVNYSVIAGQTSIDEAHDFFELNLSIDTAYSPVTDYFEIFLERMQLCRRACAKLGLTFRLVINGQQLL